MKNLARRFWSGCRWATLKDLAKLKAEIMATVSEAIKAYVDAQSAVNDKIDTAVTGLQGDVKNLTDQLNAIQNSPGSLSPADQASLDAALARTQAIADKLSALDALTPPVAPPVA